MPLLTDDTDDMQKHGIAGSTYGFSAKRVTDLGAAEYTLVGIAADSSGSVEDFAAEIERAIKEIVGACQLSPRVDNLMLRLVRFDDQLEEIHGFRPLSECHVDGYTGCIKTGGCTTLYDAAVNLSDSITEYGKDLSGSDYSVNGIAFVITDGADNRSTMTAGEVKKALARAVKSEALESVVSILVGVNVQDPVISKYLHDLKDAAGFTQYIEIGDATPRSIAKLATFVSRSISAQSQALGTGGPSQALTF